MKPEDYRKVVKFCDKGKCKVRENSFGVCWCVGVLGVVSYTLMQQKS